MKRVYIKPSIEGLRIDANISLLESSGEIGADLAEGKQTDIVEEEKTGIPTAFSNIWGDEDDED
jgi:hypothetical protein